MVLRKAATVGMPTTHGVPVSPKIPPIPPPTTTTPDGRGLVVVGPNHIAPHVFGNQFHQPNPVLAGSGSQVVKVDGLPVAFVGDTFS